MLLLTRSVSFAARHRLAFRDRPEAENRAAFGALALTHGHTYTCRVTVEGAAAPRTGMVMDLGLLDRILAEEVTARFDGCDLNEALPAAAAGTALPVCEAIAADLFPRISARLPAGVALQRVRIEEDPTLYGECIRG
ncbi:MAG: 6-pyruvoyl trahydropterin synthase family protein [Gemmatimonadales bacterium]|jgi:6-pyruvoyltetrahydropterin/6-carboxytetrahydropterin synthase